MMIMMIMMGMMIMLSLMQRIECWQHHERDILMIFVLPKLSNQYLWLLAGAAFVLALHLHVVVVVQSVEFLDFVPDHAYYDAPLVASSSNSTLFPALFSKNEYPGYPEFE